MTKIITFHKKAALYQLSGEENIKKCLVYKTYNPSVGGSNPVSIKKPLAIPVVITSSTRGGRKHFLNENYRETCPWYWNILRGLCFRLYPGGNIQFIECESFY